jgi:hypothetical protein
VNLTATVDLATPLGRAGVWSQGPVYRKLDSDFLQRPLIPKAPPAARLRIDQVDGSLCLVDPVNGPEIPSSAERVSVHPPSSPKGPLPVDQKRLAFPVLAILAGFLAGLAAALLLGWL